MHGYEIVKHGQQKPGDIVQFQKGTYDNPDWTHMGITKGDNRYFNDGYVDKPFHEKKEPTNRELFENSLKLHLTGHYMKACDAVTTPLYPHQMYALAWMANRENSRNINMKGGILADDMGLGKTLTVLALILPNFHDGRPFGKPRFGFRRDPSRSALKYMRLESVCLLR